MIGKAAVYKGRVIPKEHFRVYIYAVDGEKKLVESWDEFEAHIGTGIWFADEQDAKTRIPVEKPKRVKKIADVKQDDFLPIE